MFAVCRGRRIDRIKTLWNTHKVKIQFTFCASNRNICAKFHRFWIADPSYIYMSYKRFVLTVFRIHLALHRNSRQCVSCIFSISPKKKSWRNLFPTAFSGLWSFEASLLVVAPVLPSALTHSRASHNFFESWWKPQTGHSLTDQFPWRLTFFLVVLIGTIYKRMYHLSSPFLQPRHCHFFKRYSFTLSTFTTMIIAAAPYPNHAGFESYQGTLGQGSPTSTLSLISLRGNGMSPADPIRVGGLYWNLTESPVANLIVVSTGGLM